MKRFIDVFVEDSQGLTVAAHAILLPGRQRLEVLTIPGVTWWLTPGVPGSVKTAEHLAPIVGDL